MLKELRRRLVIAKSAAVESDRVAHENVFRAIVDSGIWQGGESLSGTGSSLAQTQVIREEIPRLLSALDARSILDAPCGDFRWLREVPLKVEYVGCDLLPEIIERNRAGHSRPGVTFFVANVVRDDLPKVDVILCRDCLVHMPHRLVRRALKNFVRSGSRYLLTTTFAQRTENVDIPLGDWRPINLTRPPMNLPEPLELINERCTESGGIYADKSLGLWELAALGAGVLRQ